MNLTSGNASERDRVKRLMWRNKTVRRAYGRLRSIYDSTAIQLHASRARQWIVNQTDSEPYPRPHFSVEFTITGRNDDYEPDWNQRLESVLRYNRRLFSSASVDFRVAFVEWNPPDGHPLLSSTLIEKFPFLRSIVVDSSVHRELCRSECLQMMLNFSLNAALRTSQSDFLLISGGDVFLGHDVASWLARRGLSQACLYRATRVDIRNDLDFKDPERKILESSQNAVRVNGSNVPPYYNACGDFILLDRESMHRIRGFDEAILDARLHLDSRCCAAAIALGFRCKHIGHVYHIDHSRSHVNMPTGGAPNYGDPFRNIPYCNPDHWGLADRKWEQESERLWRVR